MLDDQGRIASVVHACKMDVELEEYSTTTQRPFFSHSKAQFPLAGFDNLPLGELMSVFLIFFSLSQLKKWETLESSDEKGQFGENERSPRSAKSLEPKKSQTSFDERQINDGEECDTHDMG
jgi:hypothetical protein